MKTASLGKIEVDYWDHSGFNGKLNGRGPDSSIVADFFHSLDSDFEDFIGSNEEPLWFLGGRSLQLLQEVTTQLFETTSAEVGRIVDSALRKAIEKRRVESGMLRVQKELGEKGALAPEGITQFKIQKETVTAILRAVDSDLEAFRSGGDTGAAMVITLPGEVIEMINADLREAGVFTALSDYYGVEEWSAGGVLHYSRPDETWYRVFDDLELPVPRTAQFHYDEDHRVPKSMIYLNDVSSQQGAFSIVEGSNEWGPTGSYLCYRKELLNQLSNYSSSQGLIPEGHKHSIFKIPAVREVFGEVPQFLRQTGHPGDHCMDESEVAKLLLAHEKKYEAEAGTCVLFRGSEILHRGGIVESGERLALQWVYRPIERPKENSQDEVVVPPSIPRRVVRKLRSILQG